MEDFYFCPMCHEIVEAGGESTCHCNDADERGDWEFHCRKDDEAEQQPA